MTKRLIDYDVENAITPVWVNSSTDMQRHEFKQLRREWKKDIKRTAYVLVIQIQYIQIANVLETTF